MKNIVIISASVRVNRNSHRAALYFRNFIAEHGLASAKILDLDEYNFPLFEERLKFQVKPLAAAVDFATKVKAADAVLIVTPEYNGGYPASLKNAIDLLTDEWRRKPVAISTVSSGAFGGMQVITSLQYTLWKMQAWTVPSLFPVPKIDQVFDENGRPADKAATDKRAETFIKEMLWCAEANARMSS